MALPNARPVRAPRGTEISAKSWQTEAPMRMLMNNLDPEVAERPDDLVVYGGTGRAARSWEAFDAIARKMHEEGRIPEPTLAGTLTITGGCGGMGGAQPLAVTLNGGACLVVDVDETRLKRRQSKRYLDEVETDLDTALAKVMAAKNERRALSVGYVGNAADVFPELLRRHRAGEISVDVVTDQTSAHDPLSYLPTEFTVEQWDAEAKADPVGFTKKAQEAMAAQVQAMVEFQDEGAEVFDYGNSIRDEARHAGYTRAFKFPGFVPAYIRPLFCEGLGPFRWVALSGDPKDIEVTDNAIKELFPDNKHLHEWIDAAQEHVEFEGLPARICWLGYGERHRAGLLFNQLVAEGKVSAPIAIGRDHLDSGSVASPYRETESMKDGSDAIADWPLLNALTAASSGATWVSIHHGGGVGIGRSIHAGQVSVADGTELAAQKLERLPTNDPGMGVIRHADAGYERAIQVADERGVSIPMHDDLAATRQADQ
ncbi:urocanate hydratase [Kocuria sp. KD4]|uniref:urocanate hydratase n=1 Tax=Kocuria sp. KD4 TaxID=2719588 RepID=UPI0014279226|nr:urocanate hydratase [Kocuria sp. KD4]QIR70682.1 urocanate hydratase [Kocuria sp. KD4]